MTIAGKNVITLTDVLVGEVWVCSGQSNMLMKVRDCNNADQEIAAANYPHIRQLETRFSASDIPQADLRVGQWELTTPANVSHFTATGYFFGREIHKQLNVPIGLIKIAVGGTPIEAWTSRPSLDEEPEAKPILDRYAETVETYPARLKKYEEETAKLWKSEAGAKLAELEEALKAARRAKNKAEVEKLTTQFQRTKGRILMGARLRAPYGPGHSHMPSGLYNGGVAPVMPYAIKGVIWYQGETNAKRAYQYRTLFPLMIRDWRKAWGQGDFPFHWVSLAAFGRRMPEPSTSDWAELREAQSMALSVPNTAQALAIDIGNATDTHPKNKQEVGRRLALAALGTTYGKDIVFSGPTYQAMKPEGAAIRIAFDHVGSGLTVRDDQVIKGFAIAGKDQKFVWADAKIDGKEIIVSSASVPEPVAVRYAWAANPDCNLYNAEGLPAAPFRTDRWEGVTEGNKTAN